jgi:hypothetical protein
MTRFHEGELQLRGGLDSFGACNPSLKKPCRTPKTSPDEAFLPDAYLSIHELQKYLLAIIWINHALFFGNRIKPE